jgi:multidrug resistance protein, MATE family
MTDTAGRNSLQVEISDRQIMRMTLPISLAVLVPQINFITNTIFLGHLNEEALAVAGITGVYYLIFAVVGNGLNNGLQALIARRAGEGRIEDIGKLFMQALLISMGLAIIGIGLTYFVTPHLMGLALHSERMRAEAMGFLRIRIWGLPFLYIYLMRNALLVGTNRSQFLVYGTIAEVIVNMSLDYGLIFGHFRLPAIGFNGAAYASIAAEATGMIVIFAVIHARGIGKELHLFNHWKFSAPHFRLILAQSIPLILQYSFSIQCWLFFYVLIEHHGQLDLAVSNTMRNIGGIFGVFIWALGSATVAMVSNIIGQGREDQVMRLTWKIARISFLFAILLAVMLNIFPEAFLSIYGQGPAFTERAIPVLRVISIALVLMAFGRIWLNGVIGTGRSKASLLIELITLLFYCLYSYNVLERWRMSIVWGWLSEILFWVLIFAFSYGYMRTGRWKGKVI